MRIGMVVAGVLIASAVMATQTGTPPLEQKVPGPAGTAAVDVRSTPPGAGQSGDASPRSLPTPASTPPASPRGTVPVGDAGGGSAAPTTPTPDG